MPANNPRILTELQQQATVGNAQAQFELAGYYADENDTDRGLEWLNKAAGQGHVDAQFALGLFYSLGKNDQKKDRTSKMINKWCRGNEIEIEPAHNIAISLALKKNLRDSNAELAFAWFQKAAAQNHVEANSRLGQCYRDGIGTKHNDEMAFNCFRLAAEHGWVEAQYDLARCYLEGKGVQQNAALGRQWCEKAAENGFAEAQYLLACCYLDGVGVAQNFEQSIIWLNKASQNDDSVIEDKMMTRLAEAHAKGIYAKQSDTPDNNLSRGEACYRAAILYFDGRGLATDYEKGMTYLRDAIKCDHAGAKQWLENAFLQFTFPEFIGRDDAEQCYQYAYNWLSKAFEENPLDQEVNFALGVLFALGKGTTQNHTRAFEYFYKFHTGDGIDDPNPDYPDELDDLANIYCAIHENWNYRFFYRSEDSGKYFTSQFQSSREREREGNYIVLPYLVMDFYYANREFDLLRSYLDFIEDSKGVFEQHSTQQHLKKMILMAVEKEEELEEKNKELNNLVAMFAHNFLGTLQCIRTNAEHDNNPQIHLKTINMMRGVLDALKILSTDDGTLIEQLRQDSSGEGSLQLSLTNNLSLAISQILGKNNRDKISNLYLQYLRKTQQIGTDTTEEELRTNHEYRKKWHALQHQWEDEFNALFSERVELPMLKKWLADNFFSVEITGFDTVDIRFQEFGITDSIFLTVFMELFVNALKYMDASQGEPLILTLHQEDNYYTVTCKNPTLQATGRGTHKGLDFLRTIAKKISGKCVSEFTNNSFRTTFSIPTELLK